MYSDFVFLDRFLFELSCKNTHTHKHTHTHRDSNEYPIVAFSKNATIITISNTSTTAPLFTFWTIRGAHGADGVVYRYYGPKP